MKKYVLGFAFDPSKSYVVLIQKARPAWQAGLWNGVGGKREPGETPEEAMVREFREETGVDSQLTDWQLYGSMHGGFHCPLFVAAGEKFMDAKTKTDEMVRIFPVDRIHLINTIPNIPWLLAAAIDSQRDPKFFLEATYNS